MGITIEILGLISFFCDISIFSANIFPGKNKFNKQIKEINNKLFLSFITDNSPQHNITSANYTNILYKSSSMFIKFIKNTQIKARVFLLYIILLFILLNIFNEFSIVLSMSRYLYCASRPQKNIFFSCSDNFLYFS